MPNPDGTLTDDEVFGAAPPPPSAAAPKPVTVQPRPGELSDDDVFNPPPSGFMPAAKEAGARFVRAAGEGIAKIPEFGERVVHSGVFPRWMTEPVANVLPDSIHTPQPNAADVPMEQGPLYQAGQALEQKLPDVNPAFNNTVTGKASNAAGGLAGLIATMYLMGPGAAAVSGGAAGGEAAADQAKAAGATPEQQNKVGFTMAPIDAGLNLIPAGNIIERGASVPIRRAIVQSALENAAVGGSGQMIGNAAAKDIYNPDQDLTQGVPEAALTAAIGGGVVGGIHQKLTSMIATNRGKPVENLTPADVQAAARQDPQIAQLLEQSGATPAQIAAMSPQFAEQAAARVQAAQAPEFREPGLPGPDETKAAIENEIQRRQDETQGVETGNIDPAAAQVPQPKATPDKITVDSQGRASIGDQGAELGMQNADDVKAQNQAEVQRAFDLADVQRRKGEAYAQQRAATEAAFEQSEFYNDLSQRIGEDPAKLVKGQLNVPEETFHGLPPDAQERLVASAQRQRRLTQPGDTLTTSDQAGPENAGPHSPATAPMEKPVVDKPTQTELDASGATAPYRDTAVGSSDRPFKSEDSSGLDFSSRNPETGAPHDPQAAEVEQKAAEETKRARAQSEEDLLRAWQEEQQRRGFDQKTRGAGSTYAGKGQEKTFSNTAAAQDTEGRFPVDQFGHVQSDRGGPVRFGDQKQAAKWILNVGHKKSPDQIFEIANHPSGKGFTAVERGRSAPKEPPPAGAQQEPPKRKPKPVRMLSDNAKDADLQSQQKETENASTKTTGSGPDSPGDTTAARASGPDQSSGAADTSPGASAGGHDATPAAGAAAEEAPLEHGAAKPGDSGSAPADGEELTKENAGRMGGKLYGGLPLDQVAHAIAGIARWTVGDAKDWASSAGEFRDAVGEASKRGGNPARAVASAARFFFGSQSNTLRGRLRDFKTPTGEALVDVFHDRRWGGKAQGEVFSTGMTRRRTAFTNDLENAVAPVANDKAAMKQVVAQMTSGRKFDVNTKIGKAAAALRALDEKLFKYAKEAGVDIGYVKNHFPRSFDTGAVMKDPEGFKAGLVKAFMENGGSRKDAEVYAEQKLPEVLFGNNGSIFFGGKTLGGAGPTKERVFGPQVDQPAHPLNKFLVRDPVEAFHGYINAIVKRAEVARQPLLGDNFANWPETEKKLTQEGAAALIPEMRDYVQAATGIKAAIPNSYAHTAEGLVSAWTMLARLPHTFRTIVMEPLATGVQTGSPIRGVAALGNAGRGLLRNIVPLSEAGAYTRAVGEYLGVLSARTLDNINASNWAGVDPSQNVMRGVQKAFFKKTGITQIEDERKYGALTQIMPWINMHAQALLDGGGKLAKSTLQDLGVPPEKQQDFANWLTQRNGNPTLKDLASNSEMSKLYTNAVLKGVKGSTMMPDVSQRPKMMTSMGPVGRLVGQLRAYSYSFWDQVWLPALRKAADGATGEGYTGLERAKLMAPLATIPMLAAGQYLMRKATNSAFNSPGRQQTEEDQIKHAALLGAPPAPFEPLVEAEDYMSHGKSPIGALEGPGASLIGEAGEAAGLAYRGATGKSRPGDGRRAAQLLYTDVLAPSANMLMAAVPFSPASVVATQAITSNRARDAFADELAGKSGGGSGRLNHRPAPPQAFKPPRRKR